MAGLSPISRRSPHGLREDYPARGGAVFGLVVHTTGRSVVERAEAAGETPAERSLRYYADSRGGSCHYLLDYDGTVFQVAPDHVRIPHVGIDATERRRMLAGEWERDFSDTAVARWRRRWPGRRSPQHLYPASWPNECYVGVEMLPLARRTRGWHYTAAQHTKLALLAHDVAGRHDWPTGWHRSPRLLGHEDIDPYGRWESYGGWDPGALRGDPWLSWPWVLSLLDVLTAGS